MTLGVGAGAGDSQVGFGGVLLGELEADDVDELAGAGASSWFIEIKAAVPPLIARTATTPAPVQIQVLAEEPREGSPSEGTGPPRGPEPFAPSARAEEPAGAPVAAGPAAAGECSTGCPDESDAEVALMLSGVESSLAAAAAAPAPAAPAATAPADRDAVDPVRRDCCCRRRRASASRRRCSSRLSRREASRSDSAKSSSLRLIMGSVAGEPSA